MNDWFAAERHAERAYRLYHSGRLEDAVRELRSALAIHPDQPQWLLGLGRAYTEMGRPLSALRSLEKAARLEPPGAELLHALGEACLNAGRNEASLKSLKQAQTLEPDRASHYALAVEACRRMGDHEQAELMFYMAAQTGVDTAEANLFMGLSLLDRSMGERALGCLRLATRLAAADDARPLLALAHAYRMVGNLEMVHRTHLRLLKKWPGHAEALFGLAQTQREMGDCGAALNTLHRLLRGSPHDPAAHFLMGSILLETHKPLEAKAAFDRVQAQAPNYPGLDTHLARVALHRGRLEEARGHLRRAVSAADSNAKWSDPELREIGTLLMLADAPESAAPVFRELTERHASDARAWESLAVALMSAGRLASGCRAARRALRLDAMNLGLIQNTALANLVLGRLRRAAFWLDRATTLNPADPRTLGLAAKLKLARLKRFFGKWNR